MYGQFSYSRNLALVPAVLYKERTFYDGPLTVVPATSVIKGLNLHILIDQQPNVCFTGKFTTNLFTPLTIVEKTGNERQQIDRLCTN